MDVPGDFDHPVSQKERDDEHNNPGSRDGLEQFGNRTPAERRKEA
jgi:hypothetical protein